MSKQALNLTINVRVRQMAEEIMAARGYSSISGFVEELIRDEYEKRVAPPTIQPATAGKYPTPRVRPGTWNDKRKPKPKD